MSFLLAQWQLRRLHAIRVQVQDFSEKLTDVKIGMRVSEVATLLLTVQKSQFV